MPDYRHPAVRAMIILVAILGLAMLFFYFSGYSYSLGWSLSTESSFEEVIAYQFQKGPFEFQIRGEKVTLSESFFGDPMRNLVDLRIASFLIVVLGLTLLMTCATYFKQFGFLIVSALLIVFIVQLRLEELAGSDRLIVLIPIILMIGPAYYFQAFKIDAIFFLRFGGVLLGSIISLLLVPVSLADFSLHFYAQGIIPLMLIVFVFLALIAEESIFGLLYLLTRNRGGTSNHLHVLFMGGIYLANLLGYYLNKARIFDIGFTFLDPFILIIFSTAVAIWGLRFKEGLLGKLHFVPAFLFFLSLGLISFSILGWSFAQGLDGVYEGVHYLVVYTHLAFGFFFLAYIVLNFIDPLAKGLQVYKIVFKPQTFHYVTARLAGLAAIAAFYFLSSQAAMNLFRSAHYSLKGDQELLEGKTDLATTYYQNAEFYGYNAHYPNYQLGTIFLDQGQLKLARRHYEKAAQRHPSPQAFLNASNLQSSSDLSLAKSKLESGLVEFPDQPELRNNLGIVNWKNGLLEDAYEAFSGIESGQDWNDALKANRWGALSSVRSLNGQDAESDFRSGNLVVQTNILSALLSSGVTTELDPSFDRVTASPFPLHRQAFVLNSLYFFTDSTTQQLAFKTQEETRIGLSEKLAKALAMNLYASGKVKSAFLMLDQMQLGRSGQRKAEILNEMGILSLDQHAPLEARDFFTMALSEGYEPARFNRLVAFLEAGDFTNAELQLRELVKQDTIYYPLTASLAGVFRDGGSTTSEASFNELYYTVEIIDPSKVAGKMAQFDQISQGLVFDRIVEVAENRDIDVSDFVGMKIQLPDLNELDSATLVSDAFEQPFNERLVIQAAKLLGEKDHIEAYNLIDQSLEFNPYSIPLLKVKAMSAIDINLPEYARESMITLSNLMTPSEFLEFEKGWYEKRASSEQPWPYQ